MFSLIMQTRLLKVVAKFHLFRIKIMSVEIDVLFLQFYYNIDS